MGFLLNNLKVEFCFNGSIKNENSSAEDAEKRIRIQAAFAKDISDKGLLFKIYKELLKLNNKKMNNPSKRWAKDLNRHLTTKDTKMANKHKKRCSTSYVIRELKIKTIRYHYTPFIMAEIQKTDNTKC